MPKSTRVEVNTACVANTYAGPHERIVEFSAPGGQGGLIRFQWYPETGNVLVDLYRLDDAVTVRAEPFTGASKADLSCGVRRQGRPACVAVPRDVLGALCAAAATHAVDDWVVLAARAILAAR